MDESDTKPKRAETKRERFTDTWLQSDKRVPKEPGARHIYWDTIEPKLAVRVTDRGVRTFFVMRRIKGQDKPTRITLGRYPDDIGLAQARDMANETLRAMRQGEDPREKEARQRAAEEAERAHLEAEKAKRETNTFGALALRFKEKHLVRLRRAEDRWKDIERELLPRWRSTPLADITRPVVVERLEEIELQSGPYARNRALSQIRKMLNYAVDKCLLEANPAARIESLFEPGRKHRLKDEELVEVWKAAGTLDQTFCAIFRLLILTGQRRGEIAGMRWEEIDSDGILTIPGSRMKGKLDHEVPLPQMALDIVNALPRYEDCPFVFPGRFGNKPVVNFDLAKKRLIEATPDWVRPWRTHDLRRTMRAGLSKLKIVREIRERCIAHIPGDKTEQTYDVHDFRDEKREALEKWADHVSRLLNPQPNITEFPRKAS